MEQIPDIVRTQLNLKNIIPREKNQMQKNTTSIIPFILNFRKESPNL